MVRIVYVLTDEGYDTVVRSIVCTKNESHINHLKASNSPESGFYYPPVKCICNPTFFLT